MAATRWSEDAGEILRHVLDQRRAGQACGLVAVTATSGGALRAPGALAAVASDGSMVGYVSNGCVDGDIAAQMLAAMDAKAPRVVRYGAGSPWQDIRLPCGGSVELALIPDPLTAPLADLAEDLTDRRRPEIDLCAVAGVRLAGITANRFTLRPRPALRLAGRGAALGAMARTGVAAGFAVSVASPDPGDLEDLEALGLTGAHHLALPGDLPPVADDADTAVVLLFHDHEWEPALLCQALDGPAPFIGAMGSRRTHAARLQTLRAAGVDEAALARITGPLGLVPSLHEANLIALSALAQVTEHLRNPASATGFHRAA